MTHHVKIFDTTLRDGDQCPGAAMTLTDKVSIAKMLDIAGIDIIEAGFPAASDVDFNAVVAISDVVKTATIAGLCRAVESDINRAAEAIKSAPNRRIHTFISTSPIHMAEKLKKTPDEVLANVTQSVAHAKTHVTDVEWSAEDATRTERPFLVATVQAAINAGATTINLPDTVGYCVGGEYAAMFEHIMQNVTGTENITFSAHCHDDLRLATANSLAAVNVGVRQIECCVNGIGERAGNASLETIVMALKTRQDAYGITTQVDAKHLMPLSQKVAAATGFNIAENTAIIGANAFAHGSGIHQHGMLANGNTYEIMAPESVGRSTEIVLTRHSGRHAVKAQLQLLGYKLGDNSFASVFAAFQTLAEIQKRVTDEDLQNIVNRVEAT